MAEPDQGPPDEAELQRLLAAELARMSVRDVLVDCANSLSMLSAARLGLDPEAGGELDLAEARLGIDALRGVGAMLAPLVEPGEIESLRRALASLQMAYAQIARDAGGAPAAPGPEAAPRPAPPPTPPVAARPRIWTPRGEV
jgi:Domain of unknown function (DUF1844)